MPSGHCNSICYRYAVRPYKPYENGARYCSRCTVFMKEFKSGKKPHSLTVRYCLCCGNPVRYKPRKKKESDRIRVSNNGTYMKPITKLLEILPSRNKK